MEGYWRWRDFGGGVNSSGGEHPEGIPLTPEFQVKMDAVRGASAARADTPTPSVFCRPYGIPADFDLNFELAIIRNYILMTVGREPLVPRHIWMDGRKHTPAEKLFESINGEAIGHWEGDDLVVDTIGLKPTNYLVLGLSMPNMHLVERYHLMDANTLELVQTVTSPEGLTAPWVRKRVYRREAFPTPYSCDWTGDRSIDPVTGGVRFDLTPPEGGYTPPGVK